MASPKPSHLLPTALQVLLLFTGVALLLHWPPLAACADVWYSGTPWMGFEPADAPRAWRRRPAAFCLLLLSVLACAIGSSLVLLATAVVRTELVAGQGLFANRSTIANQLPLRDVEHCSLLWGLQDQLVSNRISSPARPLTYRRSVAEKSSGLLRAVGSIHVLTAP